MLNASNNQLISIALNNDLGNLKHLDISNNKLTQLLDNQFTNMDAIESINISQNQLHSIRRYTFTYFKTYNFTLDLSANHLNSDEFLDLTTPIKMINLQNNAYQMLNLTALNSIGTIYFSKNPWNCTWLLNAFVKHQHLTLNIQFGEQYDGIEYGNGTKPLIEELDCMDYRQSIEHPIKQRIMIVNSVNCMNQKDDENAKKVRVIQNLCKLNLQFFFGSNKKLFCCNFFLFKTETANNKHLSENF